MPPRKGCRSESAPARTRVAVHHSGAGSLEQVAASGYRWRPLAGGAPLDRGDDTFGDGVNIAARLQETAAPGGVCLPPRRRN